MKVPSAKRLRSRLENRYLNHCGYSSGSEFLARMQACLGPGDTIVDIGCGEGNLRNKFSEGTNYIGLDQSLGHQEGGYEDWNMRPTVVGDMHCLPFATSSCDVVALLQVLEHSREPSQLLSEISRILRPGGHLFLSVPFLHEIHHAPNDYYRYTPYALRRLAKQAGLTTAEIRASGGYFRALSHILEGAPTVIYRGTLANELFGYFVAYPLRALGWIIKKSQYLLDLQDRDKYYVSGYDCVFTKPST